MKSIMKSILIVYGLSVCTGCFAAEVGLIRIESIRIIDPSPKQVQENKKNTLRIFYKRENENFRYVPHACILNEEDKIIARISNFDEYYKLYLPGTYHYATGPFLDDERYFRVTGFGSSDRLVITDVNRKEFHITEVHHTDQPEALLEYPHANLFMYGETAILTSNRISKTEIYDEEVIRSIGTALGKHQPLLITFKKNSMSAFTVKVLAYQYKVSWRWEGLGTTTMSEDLLHQPRKVDFFGDPAAIVIDLNKNEQDGVIYRRNKYIRTLLLSIGFVMAISWAIKNFYNSLKEIKI